MKQADYSNPNTLADVMALIQVLALAADHNIRSESGLTRELQGKPKSKGALTWIQLAEGHREFFRIERRENYERVALIWKYVLQDEREKRVSLPPEVTTKLLELAISLHDRQPQRRQRFNYIWAILLAGLLSLLGILLQLGHQAQPSG